MHQSKEQRYVPEESVGKAATMSDYNKLKIKNQNLRLYIEKLLTDSAFYNNEKLRRACEKSMGPLVKAVADEE